MPSFNHQFGHSTLRKIVAILAIGFCAPPAVAEPLAGPFTQGFVKVIARPWLRASDKWIVGLASQLSARTHEVDCPIGIYAQLRLCLSSMGGTPADRSRVQWSTDDPDDDPASEFLN